MQETHSQSNCPECGLPLPNPNDGWGCPACSLRLALSPEAPPNPWDGLSPPAGSKSRFFGDYEILSEIARGGMGVVYRARQLGLNRMVALKMVQSQHLLSDEARLRFRVEIEAVAQLQHPHIVSLYESGEHEGAHFFTMRLVEGGDLAGYLAQKPPLRTAVQLLAKVCRAVHYAHQRGILHRDLKPSNILVDEQGEPHVADFGLAKSVDQDSGFTFTSSVLGSPNYMAPEQASGNVRQLTTSIDVYGLGAILYHTLAGRPPFQAGTPIETLRQVVDRDPAAPRSFNPDVDPDLETIALKCLRKEQISRYGSAEELALDLERWLHHQPILARPLTPWESFTRWSRRHPALLFLGTALSLALLTLAIGSLVASWRINQANQRTEALVTRMQIQRAETYFSEGETSKGLAMLAHVLKRDPGHEPASLRLLSALQHRRYAQPLSTSDTNTESTHSSTPPPTWLTLRPSGVVQRWNLKNGHSTTSSLPVSKPVRWNTFSPDQSHWLVGYHDGTVELRNRETFDNVKRLDCLPDGAAVLQFSPSSQYAAAASVRLGPPYEADLRIWNTQSTQPLFPPRSHPSLITDIQFTPDEKHALTVCADGRIRFWPLSSSSSSSSTLPSLVLTQAAALLLRFDPSGRWMAVGEYEGGIQVWDTRDFTRPTWMFHHQGRINDLTFNTHGTLLLSASVDDTARVWNLQTGSPQTPPLRHGNIVNTARFGPDETFVITASNDNSARLWDAITGSPLTEELPHQGNLNLARPTPDGKRIMTTTFDGSLALWELKDPELPTQKWNLSAPIPQSRFSPNGTLLASGTTDRSLTLIPINTTQVQTSFKTLASIQTLAFSPDNQRIAIAGSDRLVQVLDTTSGQPALPNLPQDYPVDHLEFTPNGQWLLILEQVRARIFDVAKGEYVGTPITHRNFIDVARFSPDGHTVITASRDRTVRLWSASSGEQLGKPLLDGPLATSAEFSPDGESIVIALRSGRAFVYATQSRKAFPANMEHRAAVTHAVFSPVEFKIATASEDQTVRIWDPLQAEPLLQTLQHRARVMRVEFSRNGRHLISLSADGMVHIWDVTTGLLVSDPITLPGATTACFSPDGRRVAVCSSTGTIVVQELPKWNRDHTADLIQSAERVARQKFVPPDRFNSF